MTDERVQRLLALHRAARLIADPESPLGRQARQELEKSTGLSSAGVELGLSECLEHDVGRATLSQLARMAPPAPRAHVLLSANVFVASFRAIALALAQTPRVFVRASRREPTMARLLAEASGGAFTLSDALAPSPGDHFWAYGADETLAQLKDTLPTGVRFHAHGSGMGACVFRQGPELGETEVAAAADALAFDTVAFDQRGCLSPRIVLVEGERSFAESVANGLLRALREWEVAVPRGALDAQELGDALRYESTMTYMGSCARAGEGLITLDPVDDRVVIPPIGRYLHLVVTTDPLAHLQRLASRLTTVSFVNGGNLPGRCQSSLGPRRYVDAGRMQKPKLDGPVDQRHGWQDEII